MYSTEPVPTWNCPSETKSLIGRKAERDQLHSDLNNSTTVKTQDVTTLPPSGIVLSGLGGIGKSRLAKAYAAVYYQNYYYQHVIWIDAEKDGEAFVATAAQWSGFSDLFWPFFVIFEFLLLAHFLLVT